jgi:excinuclease UvrABC helicase subunit UvrB
MDFRKYQKGENMGGVTKVYYVTPQQFSISEFGVEIDKCIDIDLLKMALDKKVKEEKYEEAAIVRDRISELEKS